ncbi:MAG: DUF3857 domain-containing protein [Bacteroidales bacterium]|nr:DUF3857 domain-containing protein [Bacteroidales bacterium]
MKLTTFRPGVVLAAMLLISNFPVNGQEFKMEFGDIDPDNLAMKAYVRDTSVSAMVIGDFGDISFIYDQDLGFKIIFKRHTRIKIFTKEGYDFANQSLALYSTANIKEEVIKLRATTYNLEGTKVVKSNMDKRSAIFRDEINKYWNSVKFTLPDVKEGSIIEFEYTLSSNRLFSLPVWYFQRSIPVNWSELVLEAPEYFEYKRLSTGYDPLHITTHEYGTGSVTRTTTARMDTRQAISGNPNRHNTYHDRYITNIYRMVGKDVPAFIEEPMLTTSDNYILKTHFELAFVNWPDEPPEQHTETWESINNRLMDDERLGKLPDLGIFLNKPLGEINDLYTTPEERMMAIYAYIKAHMKWDGFYSKYSESLREAYNNQSGSVADINLMLLLMLKKAGFETYPVVLSTRSNGIVIKHFPMLSSLNYVIAMVKHEGEIYLMDASDPYCTVNMLPARCLNGEGLIVEKDKADWVNLNPKRSADTKIVMSLEMDHEGDFTGTIATTEKDYAAAITRKNIEDKKSQDDYIESLEDAYEGLEIEDYRITNLEDLYKPLKEVYKVKMTGLTNVSADMMYFNPMFYERMESNYFRIEERRYPIDFGNPVHDAFYLSLKIPDGYVVEELPENIAYKFGDNRLVFSYLTEERDGVVTLRTEIHINDILFLHDDYKELKELFNSIVQKHSEMVVLKKSVKPVE